MLQYIHNRFPVRFQQCISHLLFFYLFLNITFYFFLSKNQIQYIDRNTLYVHCKKFVPNFIPNLHDSDSKFRILQYYFWLVPSVIISFNSVKNTNLFLIPPFIVWKLDLWELLIDLFCMQDAYFECRLQLS